MTRPAGLADQKLIRAALELIPETGFSGLKLRRVADRAGVNLGMFHYHFKDKDDFLKRVAAEFYEVFYTRFSLGIATSSNPLAQLRKALTTVGRFARDHRKLLLALGRDIQDQHAFTVRLIQDYVNRHASVIVGLVMKCQAAGLIADYPVPTVISFLMGALAAPSLLMALAEKARLSQPYETLKKSVAPYLLSEAAVEQRLELALRALEPERPGREPEKMPPAPRRGGGAKPTRRHP